MGLSFGFKIAPGVRIRANKHGLGTSVGGRAARLNVGGGSSSFSSGIGPMTAHTQLGNSGGSRRRGSGWQGFANAHPIIFWVLGGWALTLYAYLFIWTVRGIFRGGKALTKAISKGVNKYRQHRQSTRPVVIQRITPADVQHVAATGQPLNTTRGPLTKELMHQFTDGEYDEAWMAPDKFHPDYAQVLADYWNTPDEQHSTVTVEE